MMRLDEDSLYPYVGFTTPVYLTKEEVIELVRELSVTSAMLVTGLNEVSNVEKFVYRMLVANNILIKDEGEQ